VDLGEDYETCAWGRHSNRGLGDPKPILTNTPLGSHFFGFAFRRRTQFFTQRSCTTEYTCTENGERWSGQPGEKGHGKPSLFQAATTVNPFPFPSWNSLPHRTYSNMFPQSHASYPLVSSVQYSLLASSTFILSALVTTPGHKHTCLPYFFGSMTGSVVVLTLNMSLLLVLSIVSPFFQVHLLRNAVLLHPFSPRTYAEWLSCSFIAVHSI